MDWDFEVCTPIQPNEWLFVDHDQPADPWTPLLSPIEPAGFEVPTTAALPAPAPFELIDDIFFNPGEDITELPEIVVIGSRPAPSPGPTGGGPGGVGGSDDGNGTWSRDPVPDGDSGGDPSLSWVYDLPDEDVIVVTWEDGYVPTEEDEATAAKFMESLREADRMVRSIGDTERLRLGSGEEISGADLKAKWIKMDYVLRPTNSTNHGNDTDRGSVSYNGGNPVASFSINWVAIYNLDYAGGVFLPLHELGHLISDYEARSEIDANDIARAIAFRSGAPDFISQGIFYGSSEPLPFESD